MSVRYKNGNRYYRYTIWDKKEKKRRYLERALPIRSLEIKKDNRLNDLIYYPSQDEIDAIFTRFKEPSSAYIPLYFIFYCHVDYLRVYDITFTEAFKMSLSDDAIRLLKRQKQRISDARRLYNHLEFNDYVIVDLKTGKKLSNKQIYYVCKVIRKDICADFRIKYFSYSER